MNTHGGTDSQFRLPVYACSYSGHAHSDGRARQGWTNYQLRGLVDALHARGVKA